MVVCRRYVSVDVRSSMYYVVCACIKFTDEVSHFAERSGFPELCHPRKAETNRQTGRTAERQTETQTDTCTCYVQTDRQTEGEEKNSRIVALGPVWITASPCYWAIQAGLLTPLTFARRRLSPLAAFTSGAYFHHIHNGRQ